MSVKKHNFRPKVIENKNEYVDMLTFFSKAIKHQEIVAAATLTISKDGVIKFDFQGNDMFSANSLLGGLTKMKHRLLQNIEADGY